MTFDDWWSAYPTQEDYEANCRDAYQAGAASRNAEVAKLKDDNEYLYVAAIERDQLREQVKMLREWAVEAVEYVGHMTVSPSLESQGRRVLAATEEKL